ERKAFARPRRRTPHATPGPCPQILCRPQQPLSADHRQDHRRARTGPRTVGAALGQCHRPARPAEERRHQPRLQWREYPDPVDRLHGARLQHATLAHLPTGADLRIGGNRAFYVPSADYIQVPPPSSYFEPINWHRTVCHELGHWTGAGHRLNRDMSVDFGSESYAREELVAEISGAFVCAALSIVPTVRHADYIGSWLEVLHEDNRAIIRAASAASKAADYLLAFRSSE